MQKQCNDQNLQMHAQQKCLEEPFKNAYWQIVDLQIEQKKSNFKVINFCNKTANMAFTQTRWG